MSPFAVGLVSLWIGTLVCADLSYKHGLYVFTLRGALFILAFILAQYGSMILVAEAVGCR